MLILRHRKWTPLRLSNLKAWYAASRISGIANGGAVATWPDLSGNGLHLVQATGSKQPLYTLSDITCVRFDGTDDFVGLNFTQNQPSASFVLYRTRSAAANKFFADGSSAGATASLLLSGTGLAIRAFAGSFLDNTTAVADNVWNYVGGIWNGASGALRVNGISTSGNTGASNAAGFTLGAKGDGTSPAPVDVAAAVVCASVPLSADIVLIEQYLKNVKAGIA